MFDIVGIFIKTIPIYGTAGLAARALRGRRPQTTSVSPPVAIEVFDDACGGRE